MFCKIKENNVFLLIGYISKSILASSNLFCLITSHMLLAISPALIGSEVHPFPISFLLHSTFNEYHLKAERTICLYKYAFSHFTHLTGHPFPISFLLDLTFSEYCHRQHLQEKKDNSKRYLRPLLHVTGLANTI